MEQGKKTVLSLCQLSTNKSFSHLGFESIICSIEQNTRHHGTEQQTNAAR